MIDCISSISVSIAMSGPGVGPGVGVTLPVIQPTAAVMIAPYAANFGNSCKMNDTMFSVPPVARIWASVWIETNSDTPNNTAAANYNPPT